MYIFDKVTIKQTTISASRWSLSEGCIFEIYIFPFRSKFWDPEKEKGT